MSRPIETGRPSDGHRARCSRPRVECRPAARPVVPGRLETHRGAGGRVRLSAIVRPALARGPSIDPGPRRARSLWPCTRRAPPASRCAWTRACHPTLVHTSLHGQLGATPRVVADEASPLRGNDAAQYGSNASRAWATKAVARATQRWPSLSSSHALDSGAKMGSGANQGHSDHGDKGSLHFGCCP
jgi:hypothetical protein